MYGKGLLILLLLRFRYLFAGIFLYVRIVTGALRVLQTELQDKDTNMFELDIGKGINLVYIPLTFWNLDDSENQSFNYN